MARPRPTASIITMSDGGLVSAGRAASWVSAITGIQISPCAAGGGPAESREGGDGRTPALLRSPPPPLRGPPPPKSGEDHPHTGRPAQFRAFCSPMGEVLALLFVRQGATAGDALVLRAHQGAPGRPRRHAVLHRVA